MGAGALAADRGPARAIFRDWGGDAARSARQRAVRTEEPCLDSAVFFVTQQGAAQVGAHGPLAAAPDVAAGIR